MRIWCCRSFAATGACGGTSALHGGFTFHSHPHLRYPHSPIPSLHPSLSTPSLPPSSHHSFFAPSQNFHSPSTSNLHPRFALPLLPSSDAGSPSVHTRGLRSSSSPARKRGPDSVSTTNRSGTRPRKLSHPKACNASGKNSKVSAGRMQAKNKNAPVVLEDMEESEDEEFDDEESFEEGLDEDFDDDDLLSDADAELVDDDDFDDNDESDADAFIDDMLEEEGEGVDDIQLGDGGDGGGVNLGQTPWGEKALIIAKEVLLEFGSNFLLYAFKSSPEGCIYVRLDKLSDKYGSPTMVEIESFSSIYGKRLEEAGQKGILPNNLALEVSSPGAERAVEVPSQLERFKDLPMLVRYVEETNASNPEVVKDSILMLESFEVESNKSVWKLANVRANRELAGKGRGLTRKQKDWRAELPLSSLRLVRLYMDI